MYNNKNINIKILDILHTLESLLWIGNSEGKGYRVFKFKYSNQLQHHKTILSEACDIHIICIVAKTKGNPEFNKKQTINRHHDCLVS